MSKKTKIGILVAVGISLMVLFYFITPSKEKKEKAKEEHLTKESFKQKLNKDGLYILHRLMKSYPKVVSLEVIEDPLDSTLKIEEDTLPSIYFLIEDNITISNKAVKSLLSFVDEGNHAFVALKRFNNSLGYEFSPSSMVTDFMSEEAILNHTHSSLSTWEPYSLQKFNRNKPILYSWNYLEIDNLRRVTDDIVTYTTETVYEKPVFVRIPYGDGYFYIHSMPEVFYNESMFNEAGMDHVQRAISNLPKGHYKWHSHLNYWDKNKEVNPSDPAAQKRESPIQYVLKDRNLRYAYLLLVFSLLVYVLFKIKRRQNIIPTVDPNTNNSLEFVETVSRLYLNQEKHYKFIKHYELSFIHFIKDKYYISSPEVDEAYIKSVAVKSGIDSEKIKEIFVQFKKAKESYSFSADELIALHKKIEYFYKNCK